jgi:hypothetical protein
MARIDEGIIRAGVMLAAMALAILGSILTGAY